MGGVGGLHGLDGLGDNLGHSLGLDKGRGKGKAKRGGFLEKFFHWKTLAAMPSESVSDGLLLFSGSLKRAAEQVGHSCPTYTLL